MTIYNFHIFTSEGRCVFSMHPSEESEVTRILYGFLYSLKSFVNRVSPSAEQQNNFFYYTTSAYQLIFYEFPNGLKFVLILSYDVKKDGEFYQNAMRQIYKKVYVEYHTKNPIKCQEIDSLLFRYNLSAFLSTLNI